MRRVLKLLLIGVMVVFPNVVQAETLDVNSNEVKNLNKKYSLTSNAPEYSYIANLYYLSSEKFDIHSNEKIVEMLSYLSGHLLHSVTVSNIEFDGLTVEEYENQFKDIFGPDVQLKKLTESDICTALKYDANSNVYYTGNCGSSGPGYYRYIKSASKDNNTIYINVKTYGQVIDEEIAKGKKYILPLDIFVNGKANTNMPVNSYDFKEVDQKYGEYLDTYKFTFKKASDGEYYFYNVENLNDAKTYQQTNAKGNTQNNTKEKNPKTADQNIVIISVVGIICIGILFTCSRKVLKH